MSKISLIFFAIRMRSFSFSKNFRFLCLMESGRFVSVIANVFKNVFDSSSFPMRQIVVCVTTVTNLSCNRAAASAITCALALSEPLPPREVGTEDDVVISVTWKDGVLLEAASSSACD